MVDEVGAEVGSETKESSIGASSKGNDLFFAVDMVASSEEFDDQAVQCSGANICATIDQRVPSWWWDGSEGHSVRVGEVTCDHCRGTR